MFPSVGQIVNERTRAISLSRIRVKCRSSKHLYMPPSLGGKRRQPPGFMSSHTKRQKISSNMLYITVLVYIFLGLCTIKSVRSHFH